MTDTDPGPRPESVPLPAARTFELATGTEFIVFLAPDESGLPGDAVRRELRVAARHSRSAHRRGLADTLLSDGTAGIIGGAAWTGLATMLTATAVYLRNRVRPPVVADAATVAARLKTACEQITGTVPDSLSRATIKRLDDGRWTAEFTYDGHAVRAILDPSCTIISWTQQ
jgi:hypothetical protein